MGFEVATQQAIYTKLITNAPLMAIARGVFDHVAQDSQAFPFVTIGECTIDEWDTDTESGIFCTATIHTWSRQFGRQQTKMIQDAVFAALHRQELVVTGYQFITCERIGSESFLDPDGRTRHGVQRFKILISE